MASTLLVQYYAIAPSNRVLVRTEVIQDLTHFSRGEWRQLSTPPCLGQSEGVVSSRCSVLMGSGAS